MDWHRSIYYKFVYRQSHGDSVCIGPAERQDSSFEHDQFYFSKNTEGGSRIITIRNQSTHTLRFVLADPDEAIENYDGPFEISQGGAHELHIVEHIREEGARDVHAHVYLEPRKRAGEPLCPHHHKAHSDIHIEC